MSRSGKNLTPFRTKFFSDDLAEKIFSHCPVEQFFLPKAFDALLRSFERIINELKKHVKKEEGLYVITDKNMQNILMQWLEGVISNSENILLDDAGDIRASVLQAGGWHGDADAVKKENLPKFVRSFVSTVIQRCRDKICEKVDKEKKDDDAMDDYSLLMVAAIKFLNPLVAEKIKATDPGASKNNNYLNRVLKEVKESVAVGDVLSELTSFEDENFSQLATKKKFLQAITSAHVGFYEDKDKLIKAILRKYIVLIDADIKEHEKKFQALQHMVFGGTTSMEKDLFGNEFKDDEKEERKPSATEMSPKRI